METVALYVGNLPFNATKNLIGELFANFKPSSIAFASGRNFAYVEILPENQDAAIDELNGTLMGDHALIVKVADYTESRTNEARAL